MARPLLALVLSLSFSFAFAPGVAFSQAPAAPAAGGGQCSVTDYTNAVGQRESSMNYGAVNPDFGYIGKYQMGSLSLQDTGYALSGSSKDNSNIVWSGKDGINSTADWLASPAVQESAYQQYAALNWAELKRNGSAALIGQTTSNGTVITQSSLLYASQFGPGNVRKYLDNKGVADGAGTTVDEYLTLGSGYDVSSLTGDPTDVDGTSCSPTAVTEEPKYDGDTTSKTCGPTVAMLQAIDCGAYPSNLQGFCYRYKPLMMTTAMCNAAEKWAENVPPAGPHLESCKTQTFRDGTSSWAYVHACAKAEPAMGDKGKPNSEQKSVGAADDPACYQRLKDAGVQFTEQGKRDVSSGGISCIIPNSLIYRGGQLDFGRELQMNCRLAEQLEEFGRQMKVMGATSLTDVGTVNCRLKRDTKGNIVGGPSTHSTGDAIDVTGFVVGGQYRGAKEWLQGGSQRIFWEQILSISCSVFDGTLAWKHYKGDNGHMHFQSGETTSCDGGR